MTERRRPSKTVICSSKEEVSAVALLLIANRHTFTVEPHPAGHPWYVGVLEEGAALLGRHFRIQDTGRTLGDEPGMKEAT